MARGVAAAEAPPVAPTANPPAATGNAQTSKPAAAPNPKPTKNKQASAEAKRLAKIQKEAAAFAAALEAKSRFEGDGTSVGNMVVTRPGSELQADLIKAPTHVPTAGSATLGHVAIGGYVATPRDPVISGSATCTVHAAGNPQLKLEGFRSKIVAAYMAGVRRCAKANGAVVASATTVAFNVNDKGRPIELTVVSKTNDAIAECIAKQAGNWRFVPASSDDQAAPRVEVVLATKP